ncbi:MAG: hypothetical protein MUO58_17700 [Anaerolineales bacterium]|nr:hypothetical protein [Anaerolineales bacterium]
MLAFILALVLTVGTLTGCAPPGATPNPTRPRTPTPTLTPIPVLPIYVELSNKIDHAGILQEDVEVASGDGYAIIHLAKGTKLSDAQGQPPDSISVTVSPPYVPSFGRFLSRSMYDFSPGGVIIDTPVPLTICYDPSIVAPEGDERSAEIGYFDEVESSWTWLKVKVDLGTHCVTVEIDHLGTFIVSFEIWFSMPIS